MDKATFLKELNYLLQDISEEERQEALFYYADYFAEAGEENEEKVIRELQSPERVAAIIKAGLNNAFDDTIEYSESSMKNSNYDKAQEVIIPDEKSEQQTTQKDENIKSRTSGFEGNQDRNRILLIGIVVVAVIFGLPFFGVGFGVLASVFIILFCLGIVFGALGFASFVIAGAFIIKGFSVIVAYPGAGLISIGIGILLVALGILLFANVKWPFEIVPKMIRGIVDVVKSLVDKVGTK